MPVDGNTMLCGRTRLMGGGLVPTGLDGAYEKNLVRGTMAVFCCLQARCVADVCVNQTAIVFDTLCMFVALYLSVYG